MKIINLSNNLKLPFHVFFIVIVCLLTACDMLENNPYDVHITGEKHLTAKNISRIEDITYLQTSIKFAMISDTQKFYDETVDVVSALNARNDIDFVVHGGDLTDFGATKEFLWQRDILVKLNVPYVCVIGNHDCLATGVETYESLYGALNFAFTAGDVRFICLNTNALEFDYSKPVPDFNFIKDEIRNMPENVTKSVVLMHAGPGSDQFDNDKANEFHELITQLPNLQFCLYGHAHQLASDDLFDDGVIYYQCPNIQKRTYLVFTINANGTYTYEVEKF